jgi:hypothetical protein
MESKIMYENLKFAYTWMKKIMYVLKVSNFFAKNVQKPGFFRLTLYLA